MFQDSAPGSVPASPIAPEQIHFRGRIAAAGGLLAGALVALAWANSPWSDGYVRLRVLELVAGPATFPFRSSLCLFINEFVMTFFFMSVGLAIRRQVTPRPGGASFKMPLASALASVILPVFLLALGARSFLGPWGWLIGLGADLGFVAAALAMAGAGEGVDARRFTLSYVVAAEAVAAVALFIFGGQWSAPVRFLPMGAMAGAYALASRSRRLRGALMIVTGIGLWATWSATGLPPALAGLFLALFAASRPQADERVTAEAADALLDRYDDAVDDTNGDRCSALAAGLGAVARQAEPEVDRWQRRLLPWITFLVMPLFGWANAGVVLNRSGFALIGVSTAALLVALLLGKPAGFLAMSWFLALRGRAGAMDDLPLREVFGLSLLSAAGGAMAVYAAVCVMPDGNTRDAAVTSILIVSLISTLVGAAVARRLSFATKFP